MVNVHMVISGQSHHRENLELQAALQLQSQLQQLFPWDVAQRLISLCVTRYFQFCIIFGELSALSKL